MYCKHILGNKALIRSLQWSAITTGTCGRDLVLRFLDTSAVLIFQRCSVWICLQSLSIPDQPLIPTTGHWPSLGFEFQTTRLVSSKRSMERKFVCVIPSRVTFFLVFQCSNVFTIYFFSVLKCFWNQCVHISLLFSVLVFQCVRNSLVFSVSVSTQFPLFLLFQATTNLTKVTTQA